MTHLTLSQSAFTQAVSDVRAASAQLREDRDRIDRRVRGFLGTGWTGVAADSFVEAWADWRAGATDVLDGLVATGELLQATYRDVVDSDDASGQALEAISTRIIGRLG